MKKDKSYSALSNAALRAAESYYPEVDKFLDYLASLKTGSRVLFSYIKEDIVDGADRSEIDKKIIF